MTTINLFSANQSDAEYDISGFYTGGSSSTGQGPFAGGGVTISRDTTLSAHGAACLKAQTDGFGAYQALEVRVNVSGQFVASGTYTLSGYVYSVTGGGSLRIYCQSSSGDLSPVSTETLAAGWNRYSIEVTLPNPITQSWIGLRFDTGGTAQALTYWVDCLQFQSGNLSPWVPGGNNTLPYMAYIQGLPVDIIAGTMSIQDALGQRSTGSISVWTKPGIAWGYGTAIAIYDNNSNCAYSGFVSKDKKYKSGARLGTGILQHKANS